MTSFISLTFYVLCHKIGHNFSCIHLQQGLRRLTFCTFCLYTYYKIAISIALQFFFYDVALIGWSAERLLALPGPFTDAIESLLQLNPRCSIICSESKYLNTATTAYRKKLQEMKASNLETRSNYNLSFEKYPLGMFLFLFL